MMGVKERDKTRNVMFGIMYGASDVDKQMRALRDSILESAAVVADTRAQMCRRVQDVNGASLATTIAEEIRSLQIREINSAPTRCCAPTCERNGGVEKHIDVQCGGCTDSRCPGWRARHEART